MQKLKQRGSTCSLEKAIGKSSQVVIKGQYVLPSPYQCWVASCGADFSTPCLTSHPGYSTTSSGNITWSLYNCQVFCNVYGNCIPFLLFSNYFSQFTLNHTYIMTCIASIVVLQITIKWNLQNNYCSSFLFFTYIFSFIFKACLSWASQAYRSRSSPQQAFIQNWTAQYTPQKKKPTWSHLKTHQPLINSCSLRHSNSQKSKQGE